MNGYTKDGERIRNSLKQALPQIEQEFWKHYAQDVAKVINKIVLLTPAEALIEAQITIRRNELRIYPELLLIPEILDIASQDLDLVDAVNELRREYTQSLPGIYKSRAESIVKSSGRRYPGRRFTKAELNGAIEMGLKTGGITSEDADKLTGNLDMYNRDYFLHALRTEIEHTKTKWYERNFQDLIDEAKEVGVYDALEFESLEREYASTLPGLYFRSARRFYNRKKSSFNESLRDRFNQSLQQAGLLGYNQQECDSLKSDFIAKFGDTSV